MTNHEPYVPDFPINTDPISIRFDNETKLSMVHIGEVTRGFKTLGEALKFANQVSVAIRAPRTPAIENAQRRAIMKDAVAVGFSLVDK